MKHGKGFIAALDQSGGSTPKALALYGLGADSYANESAMFDRVHEMRCRIMQSPVFDGDRILAVILFEKTLERKVDGTSTADYLWGKKRIVPFLKIDVGLEAEVGGAQRLKEIVGLEEKLLLAKDRGAFGTKMRSLIHQANHTGIQQVVSQQFEYAARISALDMVPIIEPEIDIHAPDKAIAESVLKAALLGYLDQLASEERVILKLTLPEVANFYKELIDHPRVLRVAALSGGYSRHDATAALAQNLGMVASFSRALTEGLTAQQSAAEFNALLDTSIESIYEASL